MAAVLRAQFCACVFSILWFCFFVLLPFLSGFPFLVLCSSCEKKKEKKGRKEGRSRRSFASCFAQRKNVENKKEKKERKNTPHKQIVTTQTGEGRRFRHGMMGRSASDFADKREVYLKYLPKSCTDAQLRERFGEPHGKVVRLWHAKNQETGESKGYAFLTFEKKETARYVVRNCNQHPNNYLDGKHVEISHAQPWEKHTAKTHIGLKNIEDREKSLTAGGGVKKKQGHKHKLSAKARQRAKKRKEKEMAERLPEEEMMMPK